jgi:hypothetical protein
MLGAGAPSFRRPWVPTADLLAILAGGLTKHAGNPILAKGAGGQWDDWGVRELSPVIDERGRIVHETDGIWAYYWGRPDASGTMQIGLVTSADGGISWSRYSGNPIIVPTSGWNANDILQPTIVKEASGRRVMLATGLDGTDVGAIGCLTSFDGLTWQDEGVSLELDDFLDGVTAVVEIGVPHLLKLSDGSWLCLVEARTSGITNGWRIFGATASDPTGTWTPLNSGQPLLSPTGAGWESVGVANPHAIEATPGNYVMIYNGIGSGADQFWRVGFLYGTTLTSLTRYASNPVLTKGASGQWDDLEVEADFLLKEPYSDSLRLYYHGFDDADVSHQVGLATA